jgi:hypothetical protein
MTINVSRLLLVAVGFAGLFESNEYKVHVLTDSNLGLRVQTVVPGGTVASFGEYGDFQVDAPGVPGGRLTMKENGRLGVGSNAPLATLDVQGGADADGAFDPQAMAFQYRSGGYRHWVRTRHSSVLGSGNAIDFFVNNSTSAAGSSGPGLGSGSTQVMTLDSGRVGIGIFSPTEKLSVEGTVQSTSGGFKFPDGTVQTTAAAASTTATYTTVRINQLYIPSNLDQIVIASLSNLPAGTYLLTASADFGNNANYDFSNNARHFYCSFPDGVPFVTSVPGFGHTSMTLHSVMNISSGTVSVICGTLYEDQDQVYTLHRRLTAMKIAGTAVVQ